MNNENILPCIVAVLYAITAFAGSSLPKFETVSEKAVRDAIESSSPADNITLANKIMETAQRSPDPESKSKLLQQVFNLTSGIKDGLGLAAEAMEFRAQCAPKQRNELIDAACALREQIYNATPNDKTGSELIRLLLKSSRYAILAKNTSSAKSSLDKAMSVAKSIKSIEMKNLIEAQKNAIPAYINARKTIEADFFGLQAEPDNTSKRSGIIMKYVLTFDAPGVAAGLLDYDIDEQLRSMVSLAARGPDKLSASAAAEGYLWYQSLAAKVPDHTRLNLLFREKNFIRRFLATCQEDDKRKAAAEAELDRIKSKLASKLRKIPKGPVFWVFDSYHLSIEASSDVGKAVSKAQKFLLSSQSEDGQWELEDKTGLYDSETATAMVTSALLESGLDADHPQIKKAFKKMSRTSPDKLHALALSWRCYAWALAHNSSGGEYSKQLYKDATALHAILKNMKIPENKPESKAFYMLHVTLAMGRTTLEKFDISSFTWLKVILWCKKHQNEYLQAGSEKNMHRNIVSCATAILVARGLMDRKMPREKAMKHPSLTTPMEWIDKNFNDGKNDKMLHYVFDISRLGTARGTRSFNDVDWFNWASKKLLTTQDSDGAWKTDQTPSIIGTSLGLMTLSVAY